MSIVSSALPTVQSMPDGTRYRRLCRTDGYQATLAYYPADLVHPDHEHEAAQLTFLLCGGFADVAFGRECAPAGSRHGLRPAGARHSCRFGRGGALILSIALKAPASVSLEPGSWHPSGRGMADLFRLLFARAAACEQVIDDLLAVTGAAAAPVPKPGSAAPLWLRRVAQELAEDATSEIAAIATRAGVHRVYLSRAFHKHFGVSPTHFRLHCRSALALRHMIEDGQTPSAAAVAAGFADQAHWTRASRATAGIGPGLIRNLLAA